MYIRLIRNEAKGNAITGRLVIDGRWFCNTLERVGYQIPALCYHVAVTMSPKFKRLLPIVQNVPQRSGIRIHRGSKPEHSTGCVLVVGDNKNDNTDNLRPNQIAPHSPTRLIGDPAYTLGAHGEYSSPRQEVLISLRSNDRFAYDCRGTLSKLSSKHIPVGCRSAADVERELTSLILKAQQEHEEIILEVSDFRAGTEYGYNHPCERELQQYEIDARRAE